MSRMSSGTTVRGKAGPNVYSVLAIVATLVLAVGVGYLWMQNLEMTQTPASEGGQNTGMNPFHVIDGN